MPENPPTLLRAQSSTSRVALLVAVGLVIQSLIAAAQALLLVFFVGEGESTDAFFAAYSLYVPIAVLGVSLRRTIVPLLAATEREAQFRERAADVVARVSLVALAAGGALVLASLALVPVVARGLSDEQIHTARETLLLLAPAACLQVYAGAVSAAFDSARRFHASVIMYVTAGIIGVACSALLLPVIGVQGAALGLLCGAVTLSLTHTLYLLHFGLVPRPKLSWLVQRDQARFAWYLLAGVAITASQQIGLAIAIGALSGGTGSATLYAYAYYITGVMLNVSVLPLAAVTLPELVSNVARIKTTAVRDLLRLVPPYVFAVLLPMLAGFASFGEPVLTAAFGRVLSDASIRELYELCLWLELMMIPTAMYYLGGSMLLALHRWNGAIAAAGISIAIHLTLLYPAADFGAQAVAAAHALAALLATVVVVTLALGRETPAAAWDIARLSWPAVALSGVFVAARISVADRLGLMTAIVTLLAASAVYVALVIRLWPRVGRAFVALLRNPVTT
jgi:peptidoglycan biosynthesis protein MviN/MurJ (putative lipid II flippase)